MTELQADREVVRAAVAQDGIALKYALAELKADNMVVMEAVRQNGLALHWAAIKLTADEDVVLHARLLLKLSPRHGLLCIVLHVCIPAQVVASSRCAR